MDEVRVAAGLSDADAWRTLGPGALRMATVLVGPDDAHDITTNAFLRVARTTGWSDLDNPAAYLFRAVNNAAKDHRRQRERRWRRDLAAVGPTATADAEVHVDLRTAIARLSLAQRTVVFLAYWEDLSEPAIASMLGLSTGTVHRNLSRARAQLERALS